MSKSVVTTVASLEGMDLIRMCPGIPAVGMRCSCVLYGLGASAVAVYIHHGTESSTGGSGRGSDSRPAADKRCQFMTRQSCQQTTFDRIGSEMWRCCLLAPDTIRYGEGLIGELSSARYTINSSDPHNHRRHCYYVLGCMGCARAGCTYFMCHVPCAIDRMMRMIRFEGASWVYSSIFQRAVRRDCSSLSFCEFSPKSWCGGK